MTTSEYALLVLSESMHRRKDGTFPVLEQLEHVINRDYPDEKLSIPCVVLRSERPSVSDSKSNLLFPYAAFRHFRRHFQRISQLYSEEISNTAEITQHIKKNSEKQSERIEKSPKSTNAPAATKQFEQHFNDPIPLNGHIEIRLPDDKTMQRNESASESGTQPPAKHRAIISQADKHTEQEPKTASTPQQFINTLINWQTALITQLHTTITAQAEIEMQRLLPQVKRELSTFRLALGNITTLDSNQQASQQLDDFKTIKHFIGNVVRRQNICSSLGHTLVPELLGFDRLADPYNQLIQHFALPKTLLIDKTYANTNG